MAHQKHIPCIYVLAGTNGAGKSSIGGAMFREAGAEYFNPDEAAQHILSTHRTARQTCGSEQCGLAGGKAPAGTRNLRAIGLRL